MELTRRSRQIDRWFFTQISGCFDLDGLFYHFFVFRELEREKRLIKRQVLFCFLFSFFRKISIWIKNMVFNLSEVKSLEKTVHIFPQIESSPYLFHI